jgi:hypothetical protein
MISRRPNRWESSENAPGPRKMIATAVMVTKKVASLASSNHPSEQPIKPAETLLLLLPP